MLAHSGFSNALPQSSPPAPNPHGLLLILRDEQSAAGEARLQSYLERSSVVDRIQLSLALGHRLLDLPTQQRTLQASNIVADLLAGIGVLLVENIELLFEPTLRLDPMRALRAASRRRPLMVIWPGALMEGGHLVYAEPGHPEYRRYDSADLADVTVVDAATLRWEE